MNISRVFDRKSIEYKATFTPKRRELSRVTTYHESRDIFTPRIVVDIIALVYQALCLKEKTFSIQYVGEFDNSYVLSEDDPVKLTKSYKMGKAFGRSLGRLVGNITADRT